MKIVVFGLGYVGTVTAACLIKDGHHVAGIDVDPVKNQAFASGRSPVYEQDADELLRAGRAGGRLLGGASIADHAGDADVILVCVGTPVESNGALDLSQVLAATAEVAAVLKKRPPGATAVTIAYRSTMLPGSMERTVIPALAEQAGPPGKRYEVVYNPEFLREGTAVQDYFAPPPDRDRGASPRQRRVLEGNIPWHRCAHLRSSDGRSGNESSTPTTASMPSRSPLPTRSGGWPRRWRFPRSRWPTSSWRTRR